MDERQIEAHGRRDRTDTLMLHADANILVTGATGLIGGEFVRRLIREHAGKVYCLVRPRAGADPGQRLAGRLGSDSGGDEPRAGGRPTALAGDVTAERLGLSDDDFGLVTESVDVVLHCASELSFIREESCRRTNIAGMRNLIDLVRRCRRSPRIVHVSTATVCGTAVNRDVLESDVARDVDAHHNEYTRSKLAAEQVLRASGLPALVIRPSIVLSAELPSADFARAILWFLPLLNAFDAVPVDPDARVDVVPVAFVVNAMLALMRAERLEHDCYHVSAGRSAAMRCGQVAAFLDRYYRRTSPLRLLPPAQWTAAKHRRYVDTPERRRIFGTLRHYLPFLNMNVTYDNSRLRTALNGALPPVRPVTDYLPGLLDLITPALQAAGTLPCRQAC